MIAKPPCHLGCGDTGFPARTRSSFDYNDPAPEGRMRLNNILSTAVFLLTSLLSQAQQSSLSPEVQKYVRVHAERVVLEHVRVIDGTGKPAVEDRNVVIQGGKISAIQIGADVPAAVGTTALDLRGYSVMPGIVGMHN